MSPQETIIQNVVNEFSEMYPGPHPFKLNSLLKEIYVGYLDIDLDSSVPEVEKLRIKNTRKCVTETLKKIRSEKIKPGCCQGMCAKLGLSDLNSVADGIVYTLFRLWPKFSGCISYPVTANVSSELEQHIRTTICDAFPRNYKTPHMVFNYYSNRKYSKDESGLYNPETEYGKNRLELKDFLEKYLKLVEMYYEAVYNHYNNRETI